MIDVHAEKSKCQQTKQNKKLSSLHFKICSREDFTLCFKLMFWPVKTWERRGKKCLVKKRQKYKTDRERNKTEKEKMEHI